MLGSIDVVTSIMNDRCMREKFACLSLAENAHKKNDFYHHQQFELRQLNFGGVQILELAANTMLRD